MLMEDLYLFFQAIDVAALLNSSSPHRSYGSPVSMRPSSSRASETRPQAQGSQLTVSQENAHGTLEHHRLSTLQGANDMLQKQVTGGMLLHSRMTNVQVHTQLACSHYEHASASTAACVA